MISVGKKVNSFSGFLDGVVNFIFRYFGDTSSQTTFDGYVVANDVLSIGIYFGTWTKAFFSTEISAYQRDYK